VKIRIKLKEKTVDLTREEAIKLSTRLGILLQPQYWAEMNICDYLSVRLIGDE